MVWRRPTIYNVMYEIQAVPTTTAHLRSWPLTGKLKVCTLCGTLNVVENEECFACRWHGVFETSPKMVQMRLTQLAIQCPDLIDLYDQAPVRYRSTAREWIARLWVRIRRGSIDLRA